VHRLLFWKKQFEKSFNNCLIKPLPHDSTHIDCSNQVLTVFFESMAGIFMQIHADMLYL
jgi:hypothetical protein